MLISFVSFCSYSFVLFCSFSFVSFCSLSFVSFCSFPFVSLCSFSFVLLCSFDDTILTRCHSYFRICLYQSFENIVHLLYYFHIRIQLYIQLYFMLSWSYFMLSYSYTVDTVVHTVVLYAFVFETIIFYAVVYRPIYSRTLCFRIRVQSFSILLYSFTVVYGYNRIDRLCSYFIILCSHFVII